MRKLNDRRAAADEVLAEMSQKNPKISFVRRAIAIIQKWLRETFPEIYKAGTQKKIAALKAKREEYQNELGYKHEDGGLMFKDYKPADKFSKELAGLEAEMVTDDEIITKYLRPAQQFVETGKRVHSDKVGGPPILSESSSVMESVEEAQAAQDAFERGDSIISAAPLEPDSSYAELNRRFREEHKTFIKRFGRWLKKQLAPGGLLPSEVFDEKIHRDNKFETVEFDIKHRVGVLERAIRKDYKLDATELSEKTQQLMNDVMAGKIDKGVPVSTKKALLAMRLYIDSLSVNYLRAMKGEIRLMREIYNDHRIAANLDPIVAKSKDEKEWSVEELGKIEDEAGKAIKEALIARQSLYETIDGNVGQYVHRSYKAFDDKNWYKNIPDNVLNDARNYLRRGYAESGMSATEAGKAAERMIHEMTKNGTAYDGLDSMIRESKLGAKDLSILQRRKDIAPEIRALLGEHKDPRVNFAKSATKMGRLIFNQKFLERVKSIGMGQFLFTGKNKPPEATAKIAAASSEVLAPLNGLWTFPEVNQAFKDALGKEHMEDWYRAVVRANGFVKYGKTVLSPTTAMRNWMSAAFFTIANGHMDWSHMQKSLSGLNEYFTHSGKAEKLKYLRHLKELGVVYDTPYAGEMMRLLSDTELMSEVAGMTKGKMKLRSYFMLATKFYQFGDDFWKIIGFENEKVRWQKEGMSLEEAEIESARRVRNTYPTYSMVGAGIQSLRRFPLAGTFVSFPAEIIRTSFNMAMYVAEDMKAGRKSMALQRGMGLVFVSGFAYAAQALSMAMLGLDDEDEEAIRLMAAPWQRNANLIFTGYDEKGNIRFLDLSFMDPYNQFKRVFTAVIRSQPIDQKLYEIADEALSPFFGTDIAAGAIFETLANKKESGAPVYRERDDLINQGIDIANHIRKTLQPGIIANLERTYKAIDGDVSPSGRRYSKQDEAMAWFGFRMSTLDPKVALYYRSFDFSGAKRDAGKHITNIVREPQEVSEREMSSALRTANRLRVDAYREMHLLVLAALRSGMTKSQVAKTLKHSGLSAADVAAVINGRSIPWRPSKTSTRNQAKKAFTTFGEKGAKRVQKRYKELFQLSKKAA
jgi:hypothetical protein